MESGLFVESARNKNIHSHKSNYIFATNFFMPLGNKNKIINQKYHIGSECMYCKDFPTYDMV